MAGAGAARASAAVSFQRTDIPLGATQSGMAVGDLDGRDGPDLAAVSAATGKLTVLLNNGDGTFGAPVTYPLPAGCDADQLQLSDFENTAGQQTPDGNLDAIVYCASSHMLVTLAGNGAGGFGAPQTIPLYLSGYNAGYQSSFAIGAFGYYTRTPFVVYSATESNEISPPYFCSLDNFSHPDPVCQFPYENPEPEITGPMVAVDFDGSGQQDLLTTGGTNGVVIYLQSPGPPVQWTYEDIPFGQRTGSGANALVAAGDLNGDGVQDIVTASSSSLGGVLNTILWKGSFWGAPQSFPSVDGIDAIVTGDFDGDGHTDVMAVTEYGQAVVQSGDGAGNLGTPQSIPLIGNGNPDYATVVQAAEADIDDNGTPDVVVLDDSAGTFEVLRNLATPPSTGAPAPTPVPPAPAPGSAGPLAPPVPVSHPAVVLRPLSGVTRLSSRVRLGHRSVLTLGRAANPPTSAVTLTITVPAPKATKKSHAARSRRVVLGRAMIRIPAGAHRTLRLTLNRAGRRLLAGHARVSARLTLVATASGSHATRQTRQRKLTILRGASRRSRASS
jgi:hypothetical protein